MSIYTNGLKLGNIRRNNGSAIVVTELEGGAVDIRLFYYDFESEQVLPSKKGLVIRENEVHQLREILKKHERRTE